MAKVTEHFPIGTKAQVASGSELASSQVNTNQSVKSKVFISIVYTLLFYSFYTGNKENL